ncbi:polysaccharide deacetylase family protein [Neobacillus rhizophilus]|uniref:Polysaccharide deacetylase family protein n=1 Tax=Neobacillus rhizophilus TaxID=2833579 RepID=A0A942UDA8_9BACI|nr:polysaccharide deacetylase family protein [Neobacillus rhizophilus]MBS4216094.1 polysaccharide deacetylase family protein [Neobacillus rhizophilus]MBU8919912.1 polysaccharide deacetylase family protein [Bacillus sp. FJAT-29953]
MKNILLVVSCLLLLVFPDRAMAAKKVPILIYHSIEEYSGHGQKELYVRPENFEKQMTYLRDHGFTLLTFERWADKEKVDKPIFLTFDDGYKNNLNVFYIFQRLKSENFNPTGTFFIIADFIERPNRLSPSDLKMLANSGLISIQSHTATHPELSKIANYEYELNHSKKKIEKITGKSVIALSYPFGDFDEKVVEETKKYYTYGITTTPGPYIKTGIKNELYLLPRTYIKYSTTLEEFAKIVEAK